MGRWICVLCWRIAQFGIGTWLSVVIVSALSPVTAEARRATPDDSGAVDEFDRRWFDVRADGTYTVHAEYQIRITNEAGRDHHSEQVIPFNAESSKLKLLSARVITDDKVTEVPKTNVEIRDLGENIKFFDQQKQMLISFPNVRIGSRIYLKYQMDVHDVPLAGQFTFMASMARSYVETLAFEFISDLPLTLWKNDPEQGLRISSSRVGKRYKTVVESARPLNFAVADEEYQAFEPERETAFSLSTISDWSQYAPAMIREIDRLAEEPLPETLRQIVAAVDRRMTVAEQINRVTAMMSEEFRYFGDWRRRNGTHLPRTLVEIAATRYGDCKDLALVATAIFRALGLNAHSAWIYRGAEPLNPAAYALPTDSLFNHAITHVEADGRSYWIDPTNPVSYAQGIFADIADRPALVLRPARPVLAFTPEMKSVESRWETDLRLEIAPSGRVSAKGKMRSVGRMAISMTKNNFFYSPESNDYWLMRTVSGSERLASYQVGTYERRSRVVRDLDVDVAYVLDDIGMRTSAGLGFSLTRDWLVDSVLVDVRDRETAILLDEPRTVVQRSELVNVKKVGEERLSCSIVSPWVSFSRTVKSTPRGVLISDRIESRRRLIPLADIRSQEFAKLQDRVRKCFYRSAVVLRSR